MSMRTLPALALLLSLSAWVPPPAAAQVIGALPTRFVDFVSLSDHDDQADISVQFNCPLRYLTHSPGAEGREVRIQLQPLPTCSVQPGAEIAGELPSVMGGASIIDAVRVESDVPGQLTLVFNFKKTERFVLAQGVDPRTLRIRLFDRARGRGKILVGEPADNVATFAVNLDSQPRSIDPAAVALAERRLKVQIFTSETIVDGQTWYRLRAGPFDRRVDAERVLNAALADYPRAWLAIGDEAAAPGAAPGEGPLPAVQRIGSDPAMDEAARRQLLAEARAALAARNYNQAITALTRLQRQPEFPDRALAQELLGLARERAGQLAHAKAEYEEYLRRYPKGEAFERVTRRLQTLRAASLNGRTGTGGEGGAAKAWERSGGFGQMYRYDGTKVDNTVPPDTSSTVPTSSQVTRQSALFNDVDFLTRRRGERFDFATRISAGYSRNFVDQLNGDQKRISAASAEIADKSLGLLARVGRQMRNDNGLLGTFDGLFVAYQFRPMLALNAAVGYPVERTEAGIQTRRRFESLGLALAPPGKRWDASVFATTQQFEGFKDRQAVGFEARYLSPRMSLSALTDYDTSFKSLNAAALLGTLQLPSRWNLSLDAERRNSPVLTLRNALIGQPAVTIADLQQVFTNDEIVQLARDRTALTTNYSLTATRPIGSRFQFAVTAAASTTGETPSSGGVQGQPATGTMVTLQTQLYASNLWRTGDFNVLSLSYNDTDATKDMALGLTSRLPLGHSAWRLGPRLTIDHRTLLADDSTELTLLPSVLLDYQRGRKLLQFEAGGSIGKRDALQQTQRLTRSYVSLAYRIGF
jgi:tetratricopeptide (TPR) repeat protein